MGDNLLAIVRLLLCALFIVDNLLLDVAQAIAKRQPGEVHSRILRCGHLANDLGNLSSLRLHLIERKPIAKVRNWQIKSLDGILIVRVRLLIKRSRDSRCKSFLPYPEEALCVLQHEESAVVGVWLLRHFRAVALHVDAVELVVLPRLLPQLARQVLPQSDHDASAKESASQRVKDQNARPRINGVTWFW